MAEGRLKNGTLDFFKRVGIVTGATISMGVIVSGIASLMWTKASAPLIEQLRAESRAREQGDSLIVAGLEHGSRLARRDRLDLLDVLGYPPGLARDRRIEAVRERWEKEEP